MGQLIHRARFGYKKFNVAEINQTWTKLFTLSYNMFYLCMFSDSTSDIELSFSKNGPDEAQWIVRAGNGRDNAQYLELGANQLIIDKGTTIYAKRVRRFGQGTLHLNFLTRAWLCQD